MWQYRGCTHGLSRLPMRSAVNDRRPQVIPVYCFDSTRYSVTPDGFRRTGSRRASLIRECVLDLKSSLQHLGSDLFVAMQA